MPSTNAEMAKAGAAQCEKYQTSSKRSVALTAEHQQEAGNDAHADQRKRDLVRELRL
jgi:hypothetical protein